VTDPTEVRSADVVLSTPKLTSMLSPSAVSYTRVGPVPVGGSTTTASTLPAAGSLAGRVTCSGAVRADSPPAPVALTAYSALPPAGSAVSIHDAS
jgi:hypothetical protein